MTDEPELDQFDRELRGLLRVEPSPDFMAGVRARLQEKRSRRAWWWLAPALAACVAALLLARAAARQAPAPAPSARAAAPLRSAEPPASEIAPPVHTPPRVATRRHPVPAGRDVIIVPPEDERALLAYVAAVRARRERRLAPLMASTGGDAPLTTLSPIDIAPIETPPLPEPAGLPPETRSDS